MENNEFNEKFHLIEYESLRKEIEIHIADRRKVETQSILAIFGIYAWLLSRPSGFDPELLKLALGLPLGVALYGYIKWEALMFRTIQIGRYIKNLESKFSDSSIYGWEHSLKKQRTHMRIVGQLEGQSVRIFWIAVIALSVVF